MKWCELSEEYSGNIHTQTHTHTHTDTNDGEMVQPGAHHYRSDYITTAMHNGIVSGH
jgi:calcineurin-like phosphoesterase